MVRHRMILFIEYFLHAKKSRLERTLYRVKGIRYRATAHTHTHTAHTHTHTAKKHSPHTPDTHTHTISTQHTPASNTQSRFHQTTLNHQKQLFPPKKQHILHHLSLIHTPAPTPLHLNSSSHFSLHKHNTPTNT